ncbi:unannotated protein [freshwater metagenome]|uniref:Unannotated protein n=1 Tax=freshwater metagenome TaxID=449393 RepID=A0A6J7HZV7_9ZZZZ|nr:hypothetical protein [Actinomycetota bacterium]MSW35628.1 hypothetical protein [Actinomycetota bacterium]
MTPLVIICVAVGAALGAPARFAIERWLAGAWPRGTLVVNVLGSAVLGALMGAVSAAGMTTSATALVALVGTGFCGALTTFGGFSAQLADLALAPPSVVLARRSLRALTYGLVSVVLCVAVAALGYIAFH